MSVSYGGDSITFGDGSIVSSGSAGFKNKIINGHMMIDQRNAGTSVTAANQYSLDRWCVFNSQSSKFTFQQNAGSVTPPAGFTNYLGITSSSAYSITSGDYFGVYQRIEGYNVADLGWGTANASTVTLSFWVRSSLTGTFGGAIRNDGSNRGYPFTYTINSANTWEKQTITIPGDTTGTWLTTNGVGISVQFSIGTGSTYSFTAGAWGAHSSAISATGATSVVGTNGATFYITGVQLEKGTTASTFEFRSYGKELMLCQRYYYKSLSQGNSTQHWNIVGRITSTTQSVFTMNLPVDMRTSPSVAANPVYNTGSGWQSNLAGVDNRAWSSAPTQLSPQLNQAVFYVSTTTWSSQYIGMVVQPFTPTGASANFLEISAEF